MPVPFFSPHSANHLIPLAVKLHSPGRELWIRFWRRKTSASSAVLYLSGMKPIWLTMALLAVVLPSLHAIEKQYQTGKIVDIQQKSRTRVLYYLVNTPVTQDDPYYQVSVQFRDMIYVGEYTPRHSSDTLPGEWRVGSELQARVDKHHILVKRPGGIDLDLIIVKRAPASSAKPVAEAAPVTK